MKKFLLITIFGAIPFISLAQSNQDCNAWGIPACPANFKCRLKPPTYDQGTCVPAPGAPAPKPMPIGDLPTWYGWLPWLPKPQPTFRPANPPRMYARANTPVTAYVPALPVTYPPCNTAATTPNPTNPTKPSGNSCAYPASCNIGGYGKSFGSPQCQTDINKMDLSKC